VHVTFTTFPPPQWMFRHYCLVVHHRPVSQLQSNMPEMLGDVKSIPLHTNRTQLLNNAQGHSYAMRHNLQLGKYLKVISQIYHSFSKSSTLCSSLTPHYMMQHTSNMHLNFPRILFLSGAGGRRGELKQNNHCQHHHLKCQG